MSSPKRDLSPKRSERPARFVPTKSLEDQVAEWLGDQYRRPFVDGNPMVEWVGWEDRIGDFMRFHKVERSEVEPWPYHALLAFFIDYNKRRKYGGANLQILLERFFNPRCMDLYVSPRDVKEKLWPLIKTLGLESLNFWNDLNSAINMGIGYITWKYGRNNVITLRYHDPVFGSKNNYARQIFSPEGLDPDVRRGGAVPGSMFKEEGLTYMDRMQALISLNLGHLLSISGHFQFPHTGSSEFYTAVKTRVAEEDPELEDLIWNDEQQSVSVKPKSQ